MNLARISNDGQVTIPMEIRRALNLKSGDKVSFFKTENGDIVMNNISLVAIKEAQDAVADNDYSEDAILNDIMKERYGEQACE